MRFSFGAAGLFFLLATVAAVFTGDDSTSSAQAEETPKVEKEAPKETGKEVAKDGEKEIAAAATGKESRAPAGAGVENLEESSFGDAAHSKLPEQGQVDDIKKQRDLIEAKQKELSTREAELAARERALDEELKKLKDARDDLAKLDGAHRKESEEKVAKVVETLETMSPKSSSALIASLDEGLAVSAMARISTVKLAKIMNLMEPAKSSRLTELLAGVVASPKVRRQTASVGADTATTAEAVKAPVSTKGGKNLNGNKEQLNANAGQSGPDASAGASEKSKVTK